MYRNMPKQKLVDSVPAKIICGVDPSALPGDLTCGPVWFNICFKMRKWDSYKRM